jgi:hypothetical protein
MLDDRSSTCRQAPRCRGRVTVEAGEQPGSATLAGLGIDLGAALRHVRHEWRSRDEGTTCVTTG